MTLPFEILGEDHLILEKHKRKEKNSLIPAKRATAVAVDEPTSHCFSCLCFPMHFVNREIAAKSDMKSLYMLITKTSGKNRITIERDIQIFTFFHFQIHQLEYSFPLFIHKEPWCPVREQILQTH